MPEPENKPTQDKQAKELNRIFNPKSIVESIGFQTVSAAVRLSILIILAIFGAFVSYGMKDLSAFATGDFWMHTIILLAEQTYAFSIAQEYTMALLFRYNQEYITEKKKFDTSIDLLGTDPEKLNSAIDAWNEYDKTDCYKAMIEDDLAAIESKVRIYKSRKNPPEKKIARLETRRTTVKTLVDPKYIQENIRTIQVPDWRPMDYREFINGAQAADKHRSKNTLLSIKAYKRKKLIKKFGVGIISSVAMGLVAFDATIGAANGIGKGLTTFALIIMQLFWGFMDAQNAMATIILPNTKNKNQAAMYCSKHFK